MARISPEDFDAKDKMIHHVGSFADEKQTISVGVFSFNGGPPKVGISRTYEDRDGTVKHAKLGRLTPLVAVQLAPLLIKAVEYLSTK